MSSYMYVKCVKQVIINFYSVCLFHKKSNKNGNMLKIENNLEVSKKSLRCSEVCMELVVIIEEKWSLRGYSSVCI